MSVNLTMVHWNIKVQWYVTILEAGTGNSPHPRSDDDKINSIGSTDCGRKDKLVGLEICKRSVPVMGSRN
jgi:hypothetical protein